jgi:thiosulfate dehydrogenase
MSALPVKTVALPAQRLVWLAVAGFVALGIAFWIVYHAGLARPRDDAPVSHAMGSLATLAFQPPSEAAIPTGPSGDAIRRGEQIFVHTSANAGRYVGNGLSCSNCHLDGGRLANAAPMWAAWGTYPAYRAKNDQINTMEDRIRDCFSYSMNAPVSPSGGPPPRADAIYRDLQMYFAWLATGAPTGAKLSGKGYLDLKPTTLGYDPKRGAQVFAQSCAACHGTDGQGAKNADGSYAFNWGAGMASVKTAAGFIKANMPQGQGYTLTDQQAWDVAAFIDSRDRPRDPRQVGSVAEARTRFHVNGDYYGQIIDGHLLGDGSQAIRDPSTQRGG